jgi:opacity protein-like surface antigen
MKKQILLAAAVAMATGALAQGFSGLQVHAGVALPVGSFASDRETKTPIDGHGHAATGLNLGLKLYAPLSAMGGLSIALGLDGFYNGLQPDFLEDYVEEVEENDGEVTLPRYINVPLTVGLNYAYALNDNFHLYAEFGVGVNFSKMTNFESIKETEMTTVKSTYYSYQYPVTIHDYSVTESYKAAFGFTYGLEVGMLLNKRVSIGLRYSNLGAYKYKYTTETTGECIVNADGTNLPLKELLSGTSGTWEVDGNYYINAEGNCDIVNDDKFKKTLPISNFSIVVGIAF